jgi:hypothetical protein
MMLKVHHRIVRRRAHDAEIALAPNRHTPRAPRRAPLLVGAVSLPSAVRPTPVQAPRRDSSRSIGLHYGSGTSKSRQILRARKSLISRCRGMVATWPAALA